MFGIIYNFVLTQANVSNKNLKLSNTKLRFRNSIFVYINYLEEFYLTSVSMPILNFKKLLLWNYWDHEHIVGTHFEHYKN